LASARVTALVTGGGRGIGESIARELASAGMRVAVTARTQEQVEAVAEAVGGLALAGDVSLREDAERMVAETERALGPIDLLVNNAGIAARENAAWELAIEDWWHVFEVNVLGTYLLCRAAVPRMLDRGRGRIVNVASGAAYLPGSTSTAYSASKSAVYRFSETLAAQLRDRIPVFPISPGLVKTELTSWAPDDAPWTPPECAPRLVHALATGEFDSLSGRYLHAEHDPPEQLRERVDAILADDLNALRLRR
jgi:NAD(P)-dependent dehydrogenase (short-subunit alcohol dehydrogenase family)